MLRNLLLISLAFLAIASSGYAQADQDTGRQAGIIQSGSEQGPVTLRDSVRLDGKIVYLGDLFANVGDKSGIAVAYTPEPGQRSVLDARWLARVARSNRLDWRPLSRFDRVIVERASTVISREQIAEEVLTALSDQGADPDMEVDFSNRMLRLYVAGDAIASVGVEDAILDPRSNRFSAIIVAPAGDPAAKRMRVTGQLHQVSEIPVPAHRVLGGDVIRKQDLKWIKVRVKRLQNDVIMTEQDLIGKSPVRGLREGQPVRVSAVRNPVLVKKGSLVTILLMAPKMTLTAQGKALSDGSEGDVIQVKNTRSKIVVEAEVTGSGRVAVRPAAEIAMTR